MKNEERGLFLHETVPTSDNTIGSSLRFFSADLADFTEDPALEARLIIQKATGLSRPVLLCHPEREITAAELAAIEDMAARRKEGYPLPYLLGEWEFYGRPFHVDPSVLIPRPETELLVEEALGWLNSHPSAHMAYDIGTGSGCIAVSLLCECPRLHVTAADLHRNALSTAMINAERNHVRERFFPVQADLFSAFGPEIELVCANLPYIPSATCEVIEPARFEPLSALEGGTDGFELYRSLFSQLSGKMKEESLILCEIEYRQRELALQTAEAFFPGRKISVLNDLAGQARVLEVKSKM